jgi:hypothetical protein
LRNLLGVLRSYTELPSNSGIEMKNETRNVLFPENMHLLFSCLTQCTEVLKKCSNLAKDNNKNVLDVKGLNTLFIAVKGCIQESIMIIVSHFVIFSKFFKETSEEFFFKHHVYEEELGNEILQIVDRVLELLVRQKENFRSELDDTIEFIKSIKSYFP